MDGHWLRTDRVRRYPRVLFVMLVLAALVHVLRSDGLVDPSGKPLGYDFVAFWAGAEMAADGRPAAAYQLPLLAAEIREAVPGAPRAMFGWYYPPTYFTVVRPLAELPYLPAYLLWLVGTGGLFVVALRPLVTGTTGWWLVAAAPAVWMNAFHGQNGFLVSGLLIYGLTRLERRPVPAGLAFGLAAFKPHLAVLVPLALLVSGRWRVLGVAVATGLATIVLSAALFGIEPWRVFLTDNLAFVRRLIEVGFLPRVKMMSPLAAALELGLPVAIAWTLHAVSAAALALGVILLWRRRASVDLAAAFLAAAALLVSPHGFDYDWTLTALPIAVLARHGWRDGWLPGEREVLVAVYVMPLVMGPLTKATGIPCGLLVLLAFVAVLWRRAAATTKPARAPAPAAGTLLRA